MHADTSHPHEDASPLTPVIRATPSRGRMLGEILVEQGMLVEEDVARIIEAQKTSGHSFGVTALAMGLLNQRDLDSALSLQFGLVPLANDERGRLSPDLIAIHEPLGRRTEAVRKLRNQLDAQRMALGSKSRVIAVVSEGRGEGRSWLAANLAVVYAQSGMTTCLIDADFRSPRMHDMFGLTQHPGLSAFLSARDAGPSWRSPGGVPTLRVLTAGAVPPNAGQFLSDLRVRSRFGALTAGADMTLVDVPACDGCSDYQSVITGMHADVIVLARADRTSLPGFQTLLGELQRMQAEVLGIVYCG